MLDGLDVRLEPSDIVLVEAAQASLRRQAAQVVRVEHDVLLVVELVLLVLHMSVLGVEVRRMKKHPYHHKWPRMRGHKERAIGRDLGTEVVAPQFGAGKWVKHVPTEEIGAKIPWIHLRRSVYVALMAYMYLDLSQAPRFILAEGHNLSQERSTSPACGAWSPWLGVLLS